MGAVSLTPPQPLNDSHDLSQFECGQSALEDWLKRRAIKNERSGASRTYVVCEGARAVGYYCLSSGAVEHKVAHKGVKRNMPDPIPVMVIGRLAVDKAMQGKGLGRGLLKDAILRTLHAAEIAGIKALLVHALDETAAKFYRWNGFLVSPVDPLVLMLPLATAQKALA